MNLQNLNDPNESQPGADGADIPDSENADFEGGDPVGQTHKRTFDSAGLMLLGLIFAVGAATYVMVVRAGVQTPTNNPIAQKADGTITTFLSGGVQNLHQMMVMLHNTSDVVNQFNNFSVAHQVPVSALKTNPFRSTEEKPQVIAPLTNDAAKREAEQERQNAQTLAQSLRLDSIVFGIHSGCMINGRSYAPGQNGDGFLVERILPQSVWVRIGSIHWELKMAPPSMH